MSRRRRKRRRNPGSRTGRLSTILSILGIMLVAVFLISRVVTDRYQWSQWLWWVPVLWFVIVGWGLLLGSALAGWMGGMGGKLKKGWVLILVVQLVGCVVMMTNLVFGVWRVQNIFGVQGNDRTGWTGDQGGDGAVRVMHWNLAAGEIDIERSIGWIDRADPDVVLIANPRFDGQRKELAEGLRGVVGDDGTVRRLSRALVVSKYQLVGVSMVYLTDRGGDNAEESGIRATGGFGWVGLLRFDMGEDRGVLEVWFVDLPSEPTVHRMESMSRVAGLLNDGERGQSPGLLIGDFNTVRGSASLRVFDSFESGDGFIDAYKARGSFGGSWKPAGLKGFRGWAAGLTGWTIDLSLVGNGWDVAGYELVAPDGARWGVEGGVSHRAQVVDIVRSGR